MICLELRPTMTLPCSTCAKSICFQCDTNMWINHSVRCPYCRAEAPQWGYIVLHATPAQLDAYLEQYHTLEQITLGQISDVLQEMETEMDLDDLYDWFDELFESDTTMHFYHTALQKLKLYAHQCNKTAFERLQVIFDLFCLYTGTVCNEDVTYTTSSDPTYRITYAQHVFPIGAREYTRPHRL